ncbi:MAG: hypothetical protein L6Q92_09815 [Phycisphaerae bacterium]|nr:hypothetical protein [Phycisphaerae bacterium]
MRLISARKWMMLAAMLSGTAFQLSNCRTEAGFFAVRTAFSTIFLPINELIVTLFSLIVSSIPNLGMPII